MVYLGGPRGRRRIMGRGIYLHDPPPGYRPPRDKTPLKNRQRIARENFFLMRILTVVLILAVAACLAILFLAIVTYS